MEEPRVTVGSGGFTQEHEFRDHLRVRDGKRHREEPTHRVPDDRGLLEPQRVQDATHKRLPMRAKVNPAVPEGRGQPAPGSVRHQEAMMRREPGEQRSPRSRDAVAAMDHQHRIARASFKHMNTQRGGPDIDESGRDGDSGRRQ
jgi:hypothetical protein